MAAATATQVPQRGEDSAVAGQGLGGAIGTVIKMALGALLVGATHFAAHLLFGDPQAFGAAGVTPAGIAASVAGAIAVLIL